MKIVLAFDSYKNCLPSPEICEVVKAEFVRKFPDGEIVSLPLGDGGEGTCRAIVSALNGEIKTCTVHDPLFRKVQAEWGLLPDNSAVFEMAQASGIELLASSERNPMIASSYGTGELLKHIICENNISSVTVGIGGSATVDGGVGILLVGGAGFVADEADELHHADKGEGGTHTLPKLLYDLQKAADDERGTDDNVQNGQHPTQGDVWIGFHKQYLLILRRETRLRWSG